MARATPAALRRAIGLALVLALVGGAFVFYRLAPGLPTSAAQAPTAGGSAPSGGGSPSGPATTPDVQPSTPASLPPGPGTTEPGVLMLAAPASDGSFDIAELVIAPTPISAIGLRPAMVAAAGRDFAKARPVAVNVQLSAGDQPVAVPGDRLTKPVQVSLGAPVRRLELRYQLTGVTQRSFPSRASRALAALSPMVAPSAQGLRVDLPVVVVVSGESVRNLECPRLRLNERSCATGQPPRQQVKQPLRLSDAVVVVQLDLPRPQ